MKRIIVASHGKLAEGLADSCRMIIGEKADVLETVCLVAEENPNNYVNEIGSEIKDSEDLFIFLTDIKGGSVYNSLVKLCKFTNVELYAGCNLNMILEIIYSLNLDRKDLQEKIVQEARKGISYFKN